ncbi:MAG: hypothetical protein M1358_11080 [Chloroflexi bacterium]|nr:hypothetical protein [Chloroflexota bacterium]
MVETFAQWIFTGLSFLCCTTPGWILLGVVFLVLLVLRLRRPVRYVPRRPFDVYDGDYSVEDDIIPYLMNKDMMDHGHITGDWFDGGHHHH